MTVRKCAKYNDDFRLHTLKIVEQDGRSIPEIANELGVNVHTLYSWTKARNKVPNSPKEYSDDVKTLAVSMVTQDKVVSVKVAQKLKVPKVLVEYWVHEATSSKSSKTQDTSEVLKLRQEIEKLTAAKEKLKEVNAYLLDKIA